MKFRPIKYIPHLIVSQVFFHLFLPRGFMYPFLLNAPCLILLVMCLKAASTNRIAKSLHVFRRIALPAFAFWTIYSLSVLNSTAINVASLIHSISPIFSLTYTFLICLYCSTTGAVKRLIRFIVAAGVLQLPVVVAQGTGLTNIIPGRLGSALNPEKWGGILGHGGMIRYPGTLGSFDITSEFLGITFLLAIGLLIFSLKDYLTTRNAMLSSVSIFITGLFTATRGFIFGALVGLILLIIIAFASKRVYKRNLFFLPVLLFMLILIVIWSTPDQVMSGSMERVYKTEITGDRAFNRASYFKEWNTLIPNLPLFGYGTNLNTILYQTGGIPDAHNIFYTILLGTGWLGLATFVLLLYRLLLLCIKTIRHPSIIQSSLGIIFIVILLYWIMSEMRMEFTKQLFYVNIIFSIFGIIVVLPYANSERSMHLQ